MAVAGHHEELAGRGVLLDDGRNPDGEVAQLHHPGRCRQGGIERLREARGVTPGGVATRPSLDR